MTGTSNSEPRPRPPATLAAALVAAQLLAAHARADLVELEGGDQLGGRITEVDRQGRITLESPLSATPLAVRPEAVRRVVFDPDEQPPVGPVSHEVQLDNGDAIPGEVLAMDDDTILIRTWFAGEIRVPREHVAAVHFDIASPGVLLGGREMLEGWSKSEAWNVNDRGVFSSTGVGRIARKAGRPLPAQFVLRFRYEWKGNPNLRLSFADDQLDQSTADRYLLTINTAGMELKRQSTRGKTNNTLAQDPRRPKDISPDGMDIEIRVDRDQRVLHLLINGDLVGRYLDPVDQVPAGNGLMLDSSASGTSGNTVRGLEILEWGTTSRARREQQAEDPAKDTVFDTEGQHFSGDALQIAEHDGRAVIVFRHPHAAEPLRVPLEQAASLVFRRRDPPAGGRGALLLGLAREGALHLDDCAIDSRQVRGSHPLLGELTIDRRAIRSLGRATREHPEP